MSASIAGFSAIGKCPPGISIGSTPRTSRAMRRSHSGSKSSSPVEQMSAVATSPFDNGGPTPTISISESSVAKDLVPVGKCKIADGEDQRGRERPNGPRCDAGSFEKGGGGD